MKSMVGHVRQLGVKELLITDTAPTVKGKSDKGSYAGDQRRDEDEKLAVIAGADSIPDPGAIAGRTVAAKLVQEAARQLSQMVARTDQSARRSGR